MDRAKADYKKVLEHTLPWLVLGVLLVYTYAKFFQHPYGFWWLTNGTIIKIFVTQPEPTLRLGDHLMQVGALAWDDFRGDLRKPFFEGMRAGEITPVVVERDGQRMTIPWKLPGVNQGEVIDQFFSEWLLAYFFWLAGGLGIYFLRPRDERWLLLSGFNFLTAIWLISGSGLSAFHIWNSALVLRMAIWLSLPVYLHLHWIFPRPLGKLPPLSIGIAYGAALTLFIAQWFQLLPGSLYYLGFLLAIAGSLILLVVHYFRQPDVRRDLRLLLVAALSALVPTVALAITGAFTGATPQAGTLALLSFPLLPFAYLYAAYRRQLGTLELRLNRFLSIYLFLILLGTVGVPLIILAENRLTFSDETLVIGMAVTLLTTALSIWGYPRFQDFVERRILGIPLPSKRMQADFSSHIINSTSLSRLVPVLQDEILPSLLVRQFVFLQIEGASATPLIQLSVTEAENPDEAGRAALMAQSGQYRAPESLSAGAVCPWVRLALPLKVGEVAIGLWLFGRRDPDDSYSQAEIPLLRLLADQTAIALSHIRQSEHLHKRYEADINRMEEARRELARDLHDSVLNELAALRLKLDDAALPPGFQSAYEQVISRTREIASELRPPMLDYGLKPALQSLGDNLMERSKEPLNILVEVSGEDRRYPSAVEVHIFRIVQEACENALRHGRAGRISITGRFDAQAIDLKIEDNGTGFESKGNLEELISNQHYGLAGMFERAELIQGRVQIDSSPKGGTRIRVTWNQPGK